MDKAGKKYWDDLWNGAQLPQAVNPRVAGLNNYVNRKFHAYFKEKLNCDSSRQKNLLEIGCARSAWLPYFYREFQFNISGLDYSELGCQQARAILARENVPGNIVCADFFSPPEEMLGSFDIVVSFGVVEHFRDTAACIEAFGKFLKPGGMLVTNIPNMTGLNGSLQKILARTVYDIHVPLDVNALARAHDRSMFELLSCEYFLICNFNVVNVETLRNSRFRKSIVRLNSWSSKALWCMSDLFPVINPGPWVSPYINCIARKACALP